MQTTSITQVLGRLGTISLAMLDENYSEANSQIQQLIHGLEWQLESRDVPAHARKHRKPRKRKK